MKEISAAQMIPYTIAPTTDTGQSAPIDPTVGTNWRVLDIADPKDPAAVVVSGARMLTATEAPGLFSQLGLATDGTAAIFYPEDNFTSTSCFATCIADADVGEGVESIGASEEVRVTAPKATNVGLSSGTPVAKLPIS